ncbi:uncharacterized protein [Ovis canadensis]|uniref:uncharacterized protein n=1 Tax=Ovis canadensis TaxID=37174 RepID=UPI003751F075
MPSGGRGAQECGPPSWQLREHGFRLGNSSCEGKDTRPRGLQECKKGGLRHAPRKQGSGSVACSATRGHSALGLRTALGNLRVYGQPPGESKTPSPTSRTSEHRLTASSLATRSEGSGVRHPQPAAGSTGDWRAGPGPLRGLLGPSGLTYVVAGLQASTRTTSGAPAGPGCQQEGSGSSPAEPVARGRGRLEPPPQPDLWPHGERHTPPRPSSSPRAAAIARHFLLPTGGGSPKRASPRPSHPPDSSQQPERVQSPAPEVEETPSRAGGEPVLLLERECPPARAARDPSAHAAGRDVSLLAHAGPPSHLRRVHPHPARVARRGPRFLPPRESALPIPRPLPARSPRAPAARGPPFLPTLHGTSSPFLRTRGPTSPFAPAHVHRASCHRRGKTPLAVHAAWHEPPAVLRQPFPGSAWREHPRPIPARAAQHSTSASGPARVARAPRFLRERTIPPRGTRCASARFLTTRRSVSPPSSR